MSEHTGRPLMGATLSQNPAQATAFAQAPRNMSDPVVDTATPQGQDGNLAQTMTPPAPEHNWEKRYKDLQSFHSRTVNDNTAEIARLKAQSTPKFEVPKTAEELSAFAKENPETHAVIQSIAHKMATDQMASMTGELTEIKASNAATAKERALAELQRQHPDFEDIDRSPEFHVWIAKQSQEIKGWIFDNPDDASKINMALSLFKQNTGWGVQNSNPAVSQADANALAASQDVNVQSGGDTGQGDPRSHPTYVWTDSEIGKLHGDEYKKFEADIDLANSEGRIAFGR